MSILPSDKPFHTRPTRSFVISLLIAIGLVVAAFQSIGLYVESLWFGSLGFESVFWYRIKAQSFTFLAFFVSSMLVQWILFRWLRLRREAHVGSSWSLATRGSSYR